MNFLEIINKKKFVLISLISFFYILFNLLEGDRGLISYLEKKNFINQLIKEKKQLTYKIEKFEKKNSLLTDNIDLDYLEPLYREKFMVGKKSEKIFVK